MVPASYLRSLSLLIACCGTTSVHSLQHGEDSRAPSVLPATPPPTANRSVAWWLGDYNSGYISQNAAFLRAHGSTVTGVYHCCLGISMASNGTLAPSAVRPLPTSPPFPHGIPPFEPAFPVSWVVFHQRCLSCWFRLLLVQYYNVIYSATEHVDNDIQADDGVLNAVEQDADGALTRVCASVH